MAACARCGTRYSGGVRLCRNCGGVLPPAELDDGEIARGTAAHVPFVAASEGIRICPRCGRIVPAKRTGCESCPTHPPIVVPPQRGGACFVRVTSDYHCAGCASWVPLRLFAADGVPVCVLCNHLQNQPVFFWRVVAKHAHSVADLAGPDPEGRNPTPGVTIAARNPFRSIGMDVARVEGDDIREDDDVPRFLSVGPRAARSRRASSFLRSRPR
ncbi:hypothetical protein BH09MYX1_BH09MYX1_03410 [soil metagenome]